MIPSTHGEEPTAADDAKEILLEVEGLLREAFALESWGRLLVFMRPAAKTRTFSASASDAFIVEDLQVEEIFDEAEVDRVFNGGEIREALAALATATATLSLLADVDIGEVGGGTFVRVLGADGKTARVAFLPGTVRTPSHAFDLARDAGERDMVERSRALASELDVPGLDALAFDLHASTFKSPSGVDGTAVVLGSFARSRRSWVWAGHNPTLPEPARRRATELIDAFRDRSLWEISTPAFFTDAATAWALACVVARERGASGIARVETPEGFVVFVLSASIDGAST
jgi:hypothetical protein